MAMVRGRGWLFGAAAGVALAAGSAAAAEPAVRYAPFSEASAVPASPVITSHSMTAGGRRLDYTAEVGRVAIRDAASGEAHGYMGYIAYRAGGAAGAAGSALRPLIFVWNGGPGANSSTLHFEIVGPKRGEGARLVDNAETWLAYADLVFVDPIGTGFSRPAKAEYGKEFYGTVGDVASVTEFVRAWRLLHEAQDAPLYLAGESWGAGRAASVGYGLLKQGVPVAGLVLISGGAGLHDKPVSAELATALGAADLAPVALAHGKLDPKLGKDGEAARAQAEAWARTTYAPALKRAGELSEAERTAVIADLARYTGLDASLVDRKSLTFTPRQYLQGLLKDEGKVLNIFDMRLTAPPKEEFDGAIDRYLRQELGYRTDLIYVGLGEASGYAPSGKPAPSVGSQWNYATKEVSAAEMAAAIREAAQRGGGPPQLGPPLPGSAEAVALEPALKILVAAGRYDSLASCTTNAEMERNLPSALKASMSFRCYEGGHMFYRDQPTRLQFSKDIRDLVAGR